MTLEEIFESDGNYCDNQIYTYGCVKIAETFALRFYEWMDDNYIRVFDGWVKKKDIEESKRVTILITVALEIFKKEMYGK